MKNNLTAERLREVLDYDPETGIFRWKVKISRKVVIGREAGASSNGYVAIKIDGVIILAHRLAWMYVHGRFPSGQIDHINGDKKDNRIENLRDVGSSLNMQNRRKVSSRNLSSGVLGVSFVPNSKVKPWKASISCSNKTIYIGTYETKEEAHEKYLEVKRLLHEGCTI